MQPKSINTFSINHRLRQLSYWRNNCYTTKSNICDILKLLNEIGQILHLQCSLTWKTPLPCTMGYIGCPALVNLSFRYFRIFFRLSFWWLNAILQYIHSLRIRNSPNKRPVTRRFDVFFDLHPNKRLSEAGDLRRYWAHYDVTVITFDWIHSLLFIPYIFVGVYCRLARRALSNFRYAYRIDYPILLVKWQILQYYKVIVVAFGWLWWNSSIAVPVHISVHVIVTLIRKTKQNCPTEYQCIYNLDSSKYIKASSNSEYAGAYMLIFALTINTLFEYV